jgi:(p)ppGpp synthase/HD superfamily hydrolase
MFSFAQTNLQLFYQIRRGNYSDADLKYIANAYELATQLFTGYFRGSAKTFIAHSVGTASILTSVVAPIEVVAAGLLHAAYEFGDFGDGVLGISTRKRQQLRQVVGEVVENYVAQYTALHWNEKTILEMYPCLEKLSKVERLIILMRLANELEDHLDFGVLYCGNREKRLRYLQNCGHSMIAMAKGLGFPTLATELSKVFELTISTTIPKELQRDTPHSYLIPTTPSLRGLIKKLRRRMLNWKLVRSGERPRTGWVDV